MPNFTRWQKSRKTFSWQRNDCLHCRLCSSRKLSRRLFVALSLPNLRRKTNLIKKSQLRKHNRSKILRGLEWIYSILLRGLRQFILCSHSASFVYTTQRPASLAASNQTRVFRSEKANSQKIRFISNFKSHKKK